MPITILHDIPGNTASLCTEYFKPGILQLRAAEFLVAPKSVCINDAPLGRVCISYVSLFLNRYTVVLGPSFVTTSTRTKPCVVGAGNSQGSMRTVPHCAIIYPINVIMMKGSDGDLERQFHVRSTPYFIRN